jgi:hypothetical protein
MSVFGSGSRKRISSAVCSFGLSLGVAGFATALSLGGRAALAQDVTGSISGTIIDMSGANVKDAVVTLTDTDRGQDVRTLTTNASGFFTAKSLPLGTYTVKVAAAGFKTDSVTGLVLHVNDALTVNRQLAIGSADQLITVDASTLQLNMENATVAGLITGTQVRELVLNNRNYEQLIMLQPGVVYGGASDQLYVGASLPSGLSAQVAFSVSGQRSTQNNWTVDGADNVDRGANLTLISFPSVDAIAEFKTLRGNYSAEFGRAAGGQVNIITRSGTNAIHGTAYEFFRNDAFNANLYFNKLNGVARPLLRYNDFGYTVGGPVFIPHVYDGRDKTFFFISQELRRQINYVSVTTLVPTAAERAGDFSNAYLVGTNGSTYTGATGPVAVCTTFNASGSCTGYATKVTSFSPTALAYVKDIYAGVPLPQTAANIAANLDPHTYVYNQRGIFNDNQVLVRIDQSLGQKLNIFYRFLRDSFPTREGGGLFVGGGLPGVQTTSTRSPGTQHLGHGTYTFSSTLLAEVGYAYSSGAIISDPVGSASSLNSPDVSRTCPSVRRSGLFRISRLLT